MSEEDKVSASGAKASEIHVAGQSSKYTESMSAQHVTKVLEETIVRAGRTVNKLDCYSDLDTKLRHLLVFGFSKTSLNRKC